MGTLRGRTALVTGGSRGIGRGIAERLAREGARVAVHYAEREAAAKETVAAIEAAGGSAFAIGARLGEPGDAEALWAAFDERADGLDILVNNAGISVDGGGIAATTAEEFDRVQAVNVRAPFFVIQRGLSRLREGGRIVNLSSGLAHRAGMMPDLVAYSMTKAAVDALTKALARELGPRRITVNAVAPGVVDTEMNARMELGDPEQRAAIAGMSPLGEVATPAYIADVVAFLASADSRWVTGQSIDATGGALL
ncbi:SDR family oxidoreductase [Streptomyces sp. 3MP-14]|uniref:SDR family oxidoreductase n=1 Tax=Streptomyces mimosae TaxID=2586635 RepID=A0A5N6ASJ2_9ACTN|nr:MULTISPECIES: SDR family oxidoreductase [Streptomyces]KAB8171072.1 SDR family oxidoreductase [Streptomyces mimosae]KAB8179576.1 SDR family oxidoreductase [Streptomyces sp. 3MP-14]